MTALRDAEQWAVCSQRPCTLSPSSFTAERTQGVAMSWMRADMCLCSALASLLAVVMVLQVLGCVKVS
jgi:hypothetical protein